MESEIKSIWLLSAYRSDSHAFWADWLVSTFKEYQWHKLELPGRHFSWRIRGNPLSWLYSLPAEKPSLILATSMVGLATLKGLHPRLADVPCIYYFHENQFAYPVSDKQVKSIEPKMVQLYGALSADKILFNSMYNRDTFFEGVDNLLKLFPDEVPSGVIESLKIKSGILPVVIKSAFDSPSVEKVAKNKKLILWNHRWEYDKEPQVFADALQLLNAKRIDFELALLGARGKNKPAVLCEIEERFAEKIVVNRKVSKVEYQYYLSQASIAVSTAIHEFQGLSMLEAVSAGCIPAVPDDLCYREQYVDFYRYKPGDSVALAVKLSSCLNLLSDSYLEPPDVTFWSSETLLDHWRCLLSTWLNSSSFTQADSHK